MEKNNTKHFIFALLCPIIGSPLLPIQCARLMEMGISQKDSKIIVSFGLEQHFVAIYTIIILITIAICCLGFYFTNRLKETEGVSTRYRVLKIITIVVLVVDILSFLPSLFFGLIATLGSIIMK